MQPLEQVLARVVELVFDVLPAERAFLLLRDSLDQPLTARVLRNRDGSTPDKASLSRTIVNTVMRERVAMLAKDALYDSRLDSLRQHPVDEHPVVHVRAAVEPQRSHRRALLRQPAAASGSTTTTSKCSPRSATTPPSPSSRRGCRRS